MAIRDRRAPFASSPESCGAFSAFPLWFWCCTTSATWRWRGARSMAPSLEICSVVGRHFHLCWLHRGIAAARLCAVHDHPRSRLLVGSMILLALLFGVMHRTNPGESPVGLVSVVGAGLIFCLSLWFTGSLWWAVGFHAAWDWGQSYFYGTADSGMLAQGHLLREHPVGSALWSGGTTGPEGSVLVVAVSAGCRRVDDAVVGAAGQFAFCGGGVAADEIADRQARGGTHVANRWSVNQISR